MATTSTSPSFPRSKPLHAEQQTKTQLPFITERTDIKIRRHQQHHQQHSRWLSPSVFFKSPRQLLWQLRLEWILLRKEWPWFAGFILVQYFHFVMRNFVYYAQGKFYHYPHDEPHKHPPETFPDPPLPDLGFQILGKGKWLPMSVEWLVTFFIVGLAVLVLILLVARLILKIRWGGPKTAITDTENRPRITLPMPLVLLIKRVIMAGMIAIPLRCITFVVTYPPPPAEFCRAAWSPPTGVDELFNPLSAPRTGCGDQMFSGHTTHAALVVIMVCRYYRSPFYLFPILAIGLTIAMVIIMIMFREHYTSDIVVALYVTILAWLVTPREPATLNAYGIRANAQGVETPLKEERKQNYHTTGQGPWKRKGCESGGGQRDLELGREKWEEQVEEKEAHGEEEPREGGGGGEGGAEASGLWRTCGQRRRQRKDRKLIYVPPLPVSSTPLIDYEDHSSGAGVARTRERDGANR